MAASKRTYASASTSPTIPAIVLCDDDLVSCGVRRGKHITSQSSSSKSKTSTIAKKSSFPKLSPKPASKVQSFKKFKKKQQSVLKGEVVTGFGGPEMAVLLTKLEA
ncbi:hypothetical protein MTR67_026922 [Solanum verrucosum]|uniref:Uncharacterized protein n=1 Tax=Solanum verrucosum TaxID=315347 RepID=A0AAF0QZV5_SOLVR|nr:hypothetical protein MTR67_026922 [Solanum verrucosum]